jgi:hypothetical protein
MLSLHPHYIRSNTGMFAIYNRASLLQIELLGYLQDLALEADKMNSG